MKNCFHTFVFNWISINFWERLYILGFDNVTQHLLSPSIHCKNVNHLLEQVSSAMNPNYLVSMTAVWWLCLRFQNWTQLKSDIAHCVHAQTDVVSETYFLLPLEYWLLPQVYEGIMHVAYRQFLTQILRREGSFRFHHVFNEWSCEAII